MNSYITLLKELKRENEDLKIIKKFKKQTFYDFGYKTIKNGKKIIISPFGKKIEQLKFNDFNCSVYRKKSDVDGSIALVYVFHRHGLMHTIAIYPL